MSNKTSDKDVANIEIIENFILELKDFELNKNTLEVANALEDILAEREQDKKRIQELEKALLKVKDKNTTLFITCRNSIPKQAVIDKMEELNRKEQELQNSISVEEREEYSDANISFLLCDIEIRREILEELLQEENK